MAGIRWRYVVLVLFGLWTAFLPVLGFPRGLKNWLYVLTGLMIVAFAYYAYMGALSRIMAFARSKEAHEHGTGVSTTDAN